MKAIAINVLNSTFASCVVFAIIIMTCPNIWPLPAMVQIMAYIGVAAIMMIPMAILMVSPFLIIGCVSNLIDWLNKE